MRWIYLSPHLDDAVFSAGGLIYEQTQAGIPVEIWTIMCGDPRLRECSPFAQTLHSVWGFSSAEETVRKRREEDRLAASILGAKAVHFDFVDCIYRRDRNGDWLYPSDVFGAIHETDADYPMQVASAISARLDLDDMLVCQLGLGSHVDHALTRRAAELLRRSLLYIIDVPYVLLKPGELASKTAKMSETVVSIAESSLAYWSEATLQYVSQLPALGEGFNAPAIATESLRNYWSKRRGIRTYRYE